ncbi:MAG: RNase adaptor protein RapZ [Candidatus Aminicenantes bacterium RBG_16_63_14]|nr:MAG: RNase adaptor protein RapZ [Candidatus Aminicenantes bacterium RBG_16_63_14]OGD26797.1 MAG: RNase adaptor protein RapZ [Candidatus Aminicenantes bacterium RBG_19FT_COMBO_65_30]
MKLPAKDNRFLIVTGLSGSGKTVVSRALEDFGYYCMDNLPAKLIPDFVDLWLQKKVEIDRAALVIDIREPRFLTDFPAVFRDIRKKAPVRLIFLEATDEALAKRFNETRRPHPLAPRKPILEGVRLERKRLAGIRKMADEVIDTSGLNIYQLKDVIAERILRRKRRRTQVVLTSFGYKHGLPLDSDLVFDTRLLPNPFYVEPLRTRNGKAPSVRKFVLGSPGTRGFLRELFRFTEFVLPRFAKEGKTSVAVAVGCTGGKHRSVVIAEELRARLKDRGYDVRIYHRDLFK